MFGSSAHRHDVGTSPKKTYGHPRGDHTFADLKSYRRIRDATGNKIEFPKPVIHPFTKIPQPVGRRYFTPNRRAQNLSKWREPFYFRSVELSDNHRHAAGFWCGVGGRNWKNRPDFGQNDAEWNSAERYWQGPHEIPEFPPHPAGIQTLAVGQPCAAHKRLPVRAKRNITKPLRNANRHPESGRDRSSAWLRRLLHDH